jgi:hypothetical protein
MRIFWPLLLITGMVFPRLHPVPGSATAGGATDCCTVEEPVDCCSPEPVPALECCDEEEPGGLRIVKNCPCGGHGPTSTGAQALPEFVAPAAQGLAHAEFAPWGVSAPDQEPKSARGRPSSPPPRA